ncbi:hypothetical protein ACFV2X_48300 [Streptomyces sp. NPDC059679]|uniref:hypothetical protein n=1 Tax=Streptomyces sp. NPDC059679 TaxID=3346903 RepID=UPI0036C8DD0D
MASRSGSPRAAGPCPARSSGEDCLRTTAATVRDTVIRDEGKTSEYTLKLTGPRPVPAEVDMGAADPLLRRLRAGDRVTVTMWRDYAIAFSKDGVRQETDDTPAGEPVFVTALALAFLSVGLFVAHTGGVEVLGAPRHAVHGLPGSLVTRGKLAVGAALCAILAGVGGEFTNPIGVVVAWTVLAGLLWPLIRRLDGRRAGRHARIGCFRSSVGHRSVSGQPRSRAPITAVCRV